MDEDYEGEIRFKCCVHCGINFPTMEYSWCMEDPDSHLVPCNEEDCIDGKQAVPAQAKGF